MCVRVSQAAQRVLERQRQEEFERRKRGELQIKKEQEQDDIIRLKARKRSLEMELEAVVREKEVEPPWGTPPTPPSLMGDSAPPLSVFVNHKLGLCLFKA